MRSISFNHLDPTQLLSKVKKSKNTILPELAQDLGVLTKNRMLFHWHWKMKVLMATPLVTRIVLIFWPSSLDVDDGSLMAFAILSIEEGSESKMAIDKISSMIVVHTLDDHGDDNHNPDLCLILNSSLIIWHQGLSDEFGGGDAESVVYNLIIRVIRICTGVMANTYPSWLRCAH